MENPNLGFPLNDEFANCTNEILPHRLPEYLRKEKKGLQVSDCVGDHTTIWQLGIIATHENLFAGSFSFPSLPKSSSHTFWGGVKGTRKGFLRNTRCLEDYPPEV